MPSLTHAPMLRAVAERLHLPTPAVEARATGVSAILRLTVHFYDGRALDSVATLCRNTQGTNRIAVQYERPLTHPLTYPIPDERYHLLTLALASVRFDILRDQPRLPAFLSTDLWLLERAAGTFAHSVLFAPALVPDIMDAQLGVYLKLANAIHHALPEALKLLR